MTAEPISAIANAVSDVALLIQKAIPSDAQRMEQLKMRSPIIYAHIRRKWFNQCLFHLRFRWHENISDWVNLTGGGFTADERAYAIELLRADLHRQ